MIWWEQKEKVVAKEQFLPPLNVSQYWSGQLALGSKPEFAMLDRSFVSTLSFHTTRALLQNKNINIGVISLDTSIQSSSLNPKSQYFTV